MKSRLLLIGAAVSAIAAGVAFAAAPPAPPAPPPPPRFEHMDVDANKDGFVTRAEVQAEAERMFARLDSNSDGKLDSVDRAQRREMRVIRHEIRNGEKEVSEDILIERAPTAPDARREVRKEVRKEVHKDGQRDGRRGGRHHGPRHMMFGGGPMGVMLFINSGESDLNGDGALSKDEFVGQQLRFFDAADANRDGKIKFEPPPQPPEPPTPPAPPAAPTPPR